MSQNSMTAQVSAFSRAYHSKNNFVKFFDDTLASQLLSKDEFDQIADHMQNGISFFCPDFQGNEQEALRFIVDNQLSPTPLGRAAFCEKSLEQAVKLGAQQYLIMACGYDSFAYRQPQWASSLSIFEIDLPIAIADKQKRLQMAKISSPLNTSYISADFTDINWATSLLSCKEFQKDRISFCSLLGICYYLSESDFSILIQTISEFVPKGSAIVFDYTNQKANTAQAESRANKQVVLASAAQEQMLGSYSFSEMEQLLSDCKFLIYEHLTPTDITNQFFVGYNVANPKHPITAFDHVNYCLAVKQ